MDVFIRWLTTRFRERVLSCLKARTAASSLYRPRNGWYNIINSGKENSVLFYFFYFIFFKLMEQKVLRANCTASDT
jgi:hypothetical protein